VSVAQQDSQPSPTPTDPLKNLIGFAQITEVVLGSPGEAVASFSPYYATDSN